jgi:hypothetical protein
VVRYEVTGSARTCRDLKDRLKSLEFIQRPGGNHLDLMNVVCYSKNHKKFQSLSRFLAF